MPSSHDFKKDKRNNSIKININGKFFPRKKAKISVFDSGFILGDGCWDSIRLHNNKLLFLKEHLKRLYEDARAIDIKIPKTKNELDLLSFDFLHKRNMLFGTPEYVIEKIKELKSVLNLKNLQVWSNFPGVKHEHCMKSIKLFTEKVMPHFKNGLKTKIKKVS